MEPVLVEGGSVGVPRRCLNEDRNDFTSIFGRTRMEFKRFVNAIVLMPCQIVRGGRRLIYRLLSWNEWQGVFLRVVHALRC